MARLPRHDDGSSTARRRLVTSEGWNGNGFPRHFSTAYVRRADWQWLPTGVYRSKRLSYRSRRSRSRPRARGDDQYRGGVGYSEGRADDLTLMENDRLEEPL